MLNIQTKYSEGKLTAQNVFWISENLLFSNYLDFSLYFREFTEEISKSFLENFFGSLQKLKIKKIDKKILICLHFQVISRNFRKTCEILKLISEKLLKLITWNNLSLIFCSSDRQASLVTNKWKQINFQNFEYFENFNVCF